MALVVVNHRSGGGDGHKAEGEHSTDHFRVHYHNCGCTDEEQF